MPPTLVLTNHRDDQVVFSWYMIIYRDKQQKRNRLDITLLQKETKEWIFIDLLLTDQNILKTEKEKPERNKTFEVKRIHKASKVNAISIVTGMLSEKTKPDVK